MTLFFIVGGAGLVLLVASLVVGDLFDGIFSALDSDLFSGTALGGALTTFGFTAGIVQSTTESMPTSVICGVLAGLAVGSGVVLASRALMSDDDSTTVRSTQLIGATGTVVTDIPADGYGQVSVVASGHITRLSARSSEPLAAGASVRVVEVLSPTSVHVTGLSKRI